MHDFRSSIWELKQHDLSCAEGQNYSGLCGLDSCSCPGILADIHWIQSACEWGPHTNFIKYITSAQPWRYFQRIPFFFFFFLLSKMKSIVFIGFFQSYFYNGIYYYFSLSYTKPLPPHKTIKIKKSFPSKILKKSLNIATALYSVVGIPTFP